MFLSLNQVYLMESPIDTGNEADLSDYDHDEAFIEDERELSSFLISLRQGGPLCWRATSL